MYFNLNYNKVLSKNKNDLVSFKNNSIFIGLLHALLSSVLQQSFVKEISKY